MKTKRVKKVKYSKHPHAGQAYSMSSRLGWLSICSCGYMTFAPIKQGETEVLTPITPSRKK